MIPHDQFRKSSFSSGNGDVEVRCLPDGRIALRDSKDRRLPPLQLTTEEWRAFLAGLRAGEFDLGAAAPSTGLEEDVSGRPTEPGRACVQRALRRRTDHRSGLVDGCRHRR